MAIISSVALVVIAVITVQYRKAVTGTSVAARKRILPAMCVGAGLAFSFAYFDWSEALFFPSTEEDFIALLALTIVVPLFWFFLALLFGTVAVPTALLYERCAPRQLRANLLVTMLVGSVIGAVVAFSLAYFANILALPDNPHAFRPPIFRTTVACGIAGAVGALIWWNGMKSFRDA
ncbi:hypothetical protein [Sphingomicrobium arenosum]|uniref:hypothetical protein n=1 Tax=Sphingomicrobium arenosum TaxID=2233861 RepID=UPI00223FB059|nr:hypothetical protein [Sphingomicrobium arenosum]